MSRHLGTLLFNHGRAGGIMATYRLAPHAHHGKDLVILQASLVGQGPQAGQFGTYRRVHTENKDRRPTCGKTKPVILPCQ